MVKTNKPSRRNGTTNNTPIPTKMTAKSSPTRPTKNQAKHIMSPPKKGKTAADNNISTISPTPKKPLKDFDLLRDDETNRHFGLVVNSADQHVLRAPLSVPLTSLFSRLHSSWREQTQGFEFIDRAFEMEDDKEIDVLLKRFSKIMDSENDTEQDSNSWFNLFRQSYISDEPTFAWPNGNELRLFGLNLAASDPLSLFHSTEFDGEGNLFPSNLSVAWLGASALLGSIHLFYDLELQKNRIAAQTFEDMHEDNDEYAVPIQGHPQQPWIDLADTDKQHSCAFTYSQRLGEDAQDRNMDDNCFKFRKFLQIEEMDMTIEKWTSAFQDACTPGSLIFPTVIGREMRSFGSDLALSSPVDLFMAHEWIKRTHLRPQLHAHVWLGAINVFGPLFHHHDALCEQVINDMHQADDEFTGGLDDEPDEEEHTSIADIVDSIPDTVVEEKNAKKQRMTPDDASAATAPAGAATLHQQRLSGKDRNHQLRYDLRFHVQPSKEADKTMIAAAKKFFSKVKEMDDTIVIYPWFKSSKNSKIQETRLIPEKMGAFKAYFHQANPRVDGGFVYMRVWLGHDKEPDMLKDDLNWWMRQQQFGMYPRSVQAENIAVIGWLLYSTRAINCSSLQTALEKRFHGKFEVGCRYRMISLGRRGSIPKEQQIKAIHIECDSEVQYELKNALSKIYASSKNEDYPNGIRMRLVPEMNSMISPDTRQNVNRLRARQDNFQKQVLSALSWDISALDYVDGKIGRSLRDLVMKIESRTIPGQQLFHVVDETWNQNGFHFAFFPNVETEARSMMMALLPFLVHHYGQTAIKWFSSSAQRRSQGAEWDPDKGCVKTFDDDAVSWMMTEDGFAAFDQAKDTPGSDARPDPSNLQTAAGAAGLIGDQDSVGTFNQKATTVSDSVQDPAPLITGTTAPSLPRVLPRHTDGESESIGSRSTRSSITASLFSRISQMETTLAKVDQLDSLMSRIAGKLGILDDPPPEPSQSPIPPPATVLVQVAHPAPVTQLESAPASPPTDFNPNTPPDDGRPLTHVGPSSTPRALPEIRQSLSEQASADVSSTDVGHVR
jgi:hypothetical protein